MERLTTKDYKNWTYGVGYQNKKDSKLRTKIEHKLGEFEDFMEENNLKDLNQLKLMAIFYESFSKKRENQIINEYLEIKKLLKEHNLDFDKLKQIIEWLDRLTARDFDFMQFMCQERAKIYDMVKSTDLENQSLKDRWEKLKEWIANTKPLMGKNLYFLQETLLDKIEELEKE